MKKWEKFSEEELSLIVKESYSFREVAKKIGYQENGGTGQSEAKKLVEKYSFDVSHFTGQGWNKGKVDTEKYYYGNALRRGQALRDLIILRGYQCEDCGLTEWKGQTIPLEVHHIDGDYLNSQLENLKLLCPNCHALTENYRSKNIRKEVDEETLVEALKTTPNIRQALMKVGLTGKGKNYDRCYDLIHKYNIKQGE